MKSNVCRLDETELDSILSEVDKSAVYNSLDKKQTIRLRLLAEELIRMLPELLKYCDGEFWVENEDKEFSLHARVVPTNFEPDTFDKLLSVSKSGKNAAAEGIVNKIRFAVEYMLGVYSDKTVLEAASYSNSMYDYGMTSNPYWSNSWSLLRYMNSIEENHNNGESDEEWDELEKSKIANLADDVIVGIKGSQVDIIIKKKF
ncbi:MAG: hypothetical protein IJ736_01935 [Firmicutes bacterium]|nr:hypothetical protein [Bacillota bacterium]